jgi:hypothetical protein
MLPQAPVRSRTINPVTPLIADVLFTELVDCNRRELPAYGTAHPDTNKWPNHKLALIKPFQDGKREEIYTFYYVADRESQDLYNWEYTQADIGGTKFDAVTRTYVIPRSDYDPDEGGDEVSEQETGGSDDFLGAQTGSLVDRQIKRIGESELDSLYVVVQNTYAALAVLVQYDFDEAFGCFLMSSQELVPKGDEPEAGFEGESDNIAVETRDLTSRWTLVTRRELVCDALLEGIEYTTTKDYGFPAVLHGVRADSWGRRDGGSETYLSPLFSRSAFKGPCAFRVVQTWSKEPVAVAAGDIFNPQPTPINISCPLFSLSIAPCLHGLVEIDVSTGTEHPVYVYTAGTFEVSATSPAYLVDDDEHCVSREQERFRGGFLTTEHYVTVPYAPPALEA